MPLKDIFSKKTESETEEYMELDFEPSDTTGKMLIEIEKMEDYLDSDRIQKKVREGNIVIINIKPLKDKDMAELKRAIERISKTCTAINGDIAGVSDEWIVAAPAGAGIKREKVLPPEPTEPEEPGEPIVQTPANPESDTSDEKNEAGFTSPFK
jgi:SepF-like predicted cell division protein (DUF552 family)